MIRLIRRRLIIPRGDTGSFSIPTIGTVSDGDIAIFGIFDPLTHKTLVMKKIQATSPTLTIALESEDTINLEPRRYKWDITVYKSPIYDEEGELIGAAETNSYYSAFKLPVCEITEVALDMNRERWRTSALTLNTNDYQVSNNIQTVYPWARLQRSELQEQLYQLAVDGGYTGSKDDFTSSYNNMFVNGTIQSGTIDTFPVPGDEKNLYFDTNTTILYYYKVSTEPVNSALLNLIGVRIEETEENGTLYHLYIPIKALGIIG